MKCTIVMRDTANSRIELKRYGKDKTAKTGWFKWMSYDYSEPPIFMFEDNTCGSIDVILVRAEVPWYMYPVLLARFYKTALTYIGWGDVCTRKGLHFVPYEHHDFEEDE